MKASTHAMAAQVLMYDAINFDEGFFCGVAFAWPSKALMMRTTVSVDDSLYEDAVALLDPDVDRKELFRESLKVFVRVQSAKRLAELGGKIKRIKTTPRRRHDG